MNVKKEIQRMISSGNRALEEGTPEQQEQVVKQVSSWLENYGYPITNGNGYTTIMEMNAINNAFNSDGICYPKSMNTGLYFELLKQAKYWANFVNIVNWDSLNISTKKCVPTLLLGLFLYGSCAVTYVNGELIPYILTGTILYDHNGYPIKSEGYPLAMCIGSGVIDFDFDSKQYKISDKAKKALKDYRKDLDTNNAVFGRFNKFGYGAWLLETPFLYRLLSNLQRVETCASLSSIMLEYKVFNPKSNADITSLQNNNGVIKTVAGIDGKFNAIDVGNGGSTLKSLIDYIEWFKNWHYEFTGRRYNINEKQERNINSEVQYSQLNFEILEKEHLYELDIMFSQIKEKWGIDIQVSSPVVSNDVNGNETQNINDNENDKFEKRII